MKTINFACLLIGLFGIAPLEVFSISCMQAGPDTIITNSVITGSCISNGDLIILNGASLHVDLTGVAADTFIVRGNILPNAVRSLTAKLLHLPTTDENLPISAYAVRLSE